MRPVPSLLEWLNRECEVMVNRNPSGDPGFLRSATLDRLRQAYAFPLKMVIHGYIADVRHLGDGHGGTLRYLELIPRGFSPQAHRVLGGILFHTDRPLQAGSVVMAAVELADPGTYSLHPPALLATLHELKTTVAVEP